MPSKCIVMRAVIRAAAIAAILRGPPTVAGYRWSVVDQDVTDVCNGQKCAGRPHSVCLPTVPDLNSRACRQFRRYEMLAIDEDSVRNIVDGHNGLRNRVALDYYWPASNVNLLHWDRDLQRMAEGWLALCHLGRTDDCGFIYTRNLTVGQNVAYLPDFPGDYWESSIIREWYLDGNAIAAHSSVLESWRPIEQGNYTRLIWATEQFVGCAAARVNDGYTMVCNYYPAGNVIGEPVLIFGAACRNCSQGRPSCSRVFHGLCGLDVPDTRVAEHIWFVCGICVALSLWIVGICAMWYTLS